MFMEDLLLQLKLHIDQFSFYEIIFFFVYIMKLKQLFTLQ